MYSCSLHIPLLMIVRISVQHVIIIKSEILITSPLQWRHNQRDGVANHLCLDWMLNRLFKRWSMKTSKPRLTGLCEGNPPLTGGFPSQRPSNTENVCIWWRLYALFMVREWNNGIHYLSCSAFMHACMVNLKGFCSHMWWSRKRCKQNTLLDRFVNAKTTQLY